MINRNQEMAIAVNKRQAGILPGLGSLWDIASLSQM